MALGDGVNWNESVPDNNTLAYLIDDYDRDLRVGVRKRLDREHVWSDSQTATNEGGHHRYITFQAQTAAPTLIATSAGAIYVGASSAGYPLMFENSGGTEYTIVSSAGEFGGGSPAGAIISYGGTAGPTGWYLCNGAAVSRTTDSALYAAISTRFGTGDGSTTFNVPNLAGKVLAGYTSTNSNFSTVGTSGGEATHVLTVAEMAAHTHTIEGGSTAVVRNDYTNVVVMVNAGTVSGSTGGGGAHNNLQPYVTVNYIIKR